MQIDFDFDKDGVVDFKGRFGDRHRDRSMDEPFETAVASSACDGIFDTELAYSTSGQITEFLYDANQDGTPEAHDPLEGFRWMASRCEIWEEWAARSERFEARQDSVMVLEEGISEERRSASP